MLVKMLYKLRVDKNYRIPLSLVLLLYLVYLLPLGRIDVTVDTSLTKSFRAISIEVLILSFVFRLKSIGISTSKVYAPSNFFYNKD
jgi:hypothetical protein